MQEQQAATAEILRVISSSPTDVAPVFETIVRSAQRLLGAFSSALTRRVGDELQLAALTSTTPAGDEALRRAYPVSIATGVSGHAEVVRSCAPLMIADTEALPEGLRDFARTRDFRSVLLVPLLHDGVAIGSLGVSRREPGPFADDQVALLKTFADQAVIAIENARLFTELQEKNQALTETHAQVTESLDQQTATSEILRAISQSQSDVQPIFETITRNAMRLCDGLFSSLYRFDGESIDQVAQHNYTPEALAEVRRTFPTRPTRTLAAGRAVLDGIVVELPDIDVEPGYRAAIARAVGARSILAVPMLRDGVPIGAISVARAETGRFSNTQIDLLQTFADQAVIAIENVRLFKELQTSNRDLTTALDKQTATSDILRVISQSQTDVQPVFDVIARSAHQLLGGYAAALVHLVGNKVHLGAYTTTRNEGDTTLTSRFPLSIDQLASQNPSLARVLLDGEIDHVPDFEDPSVGEFARSLARARGHRSRVMVPLRLGGTVVGGLAVTRAHSGRFSEDEIALLRTFADQAVIAIENVRLFTELQASNRELTQTLDQQTATSEILRVISSAHIDAQPVFDTIVQSAARLCHATVAAVFRSDGSTLYNPGSYGDAPDVLAAVRARYPRPVDMGTMAGIAILTRSVVHFPDIEESTIPEHVRQVGRLLGFRSGVAVPMLREGEAVGALLVARREPGWFSDTEVELLKTFGAQAVIAIENVRLFTELQARTAALTRSVGQLTALGEVGRAVSSTLDLEAVLTTIVSRAVQLTQMEGGVVFEYDELAEEFVQRAAAETGGVLAQARRGVRYRKGEGALGRTAITLEPVQVADITVPGAYESRVRENLIESGIRAILAVPMVHQGRLIGCLGVTRSQPGDFPAETITLLQTFATQSALAIQNARLFREIADKSRQVEAASQHKSEFLANMSHELRTPLNAIIGFSEVLSDRMFGELNEKQEEYLKDIYASGTHLLSLINDILDLSKIEAGRMELELTDFDLPAAIENALMLVRERAGRRSITLHTNIDDRLGQIQADERKVRQVVLNLLSNAIKFTPEGGRIDVGAVSKDGSVEISVSDTGIGIAPEDQEKVFEEFRQVGTAAKKVEGTGLGLTLCRKFVELHGGRIWVKSEVGMGSTFTFTIPTHQGE